MSKNKMTTTHMMTGSVHLCEAELICRMYEAVMGEKRP
jgi:hypothetical protein